MSFALDPLTTTKTFVLFLFILFIVRNKPRKLMMITPVVSLMHHYTILIATQLNWAFNFLLYNSFSFNNSISKYHHIPAEVNIIEEELSVSRYQCNVPAGSSSSEAVDLCAVCLCNIEDGEEIRELRCSHLFHRVCLDRWIGDKQYATCPLCRDYLFGPFRAMTDQLRMEVLVLKFWCFGSDERESWWLR